MTTQLHKLQCGQHFGKVAGAPCNKCNSGVLNQARDERLLAAVEPQETTTPSNDWKVGDIVYNSWGYDQTNVDWYQVIAVTPKTVRLRKIAGKSANKSSSGMSGYSIPDKDNFQWAEDRYMVKRIRPGQPYLKFRFGCGCKWDGKPRYESWYA